MKLQSNTLAIMIYVELPAEIRAVPQRLPFYLAMEEYLARKFNGEYFFMWQVRPTVIFGRNQIIDAEVNLPFCRQQGIETFRRKSGGGCVYADMNNIMFSHITTSDMVVTTFSHYTSMVAEMLCRLGIDARTTGRNDIMIGDRKVSGYAFYHINLHNSVNKAAATSRAIVHGTMLYDADTATMTQALTPSAVKLSAKGIDSVRSHVTTIRQHSPVGLADFMAFARKELCDSTLTLTADDVEAIREIAEPYYEESWIYGRRRNAGMPAKIPTRVEGVGEFLIDLTAEGTPQPRIGSIDIKGDFFLAADPDSTLIGPLTGCPLTESALTEVLDGIPLEKIIPGLSRNRLTRMILAEHEAAGGSSPTQTAE